MKSGKTRGKPQKGIKGKRKKEEEKSQFAPKRSDRIKEIVQGRPPKDKGIKTEDSAENASIDKE